MRRLTLRREALTELTPAVLTGLVGGSVRTTTTVTTATTATTFRTDGIGCILSGGRTCEGHELTDTCPL